MRNPDTANNTNGAELYLDRTTLGATQYAAVGMGGTTRNFYINVGGGADDINIAPTGTVTVNTQINANAPAGTAPIYTTNTVLCAGINANYLQGYTQDEFQHAMTDIVATSTANVTPSADTGFTLVRPAATNTYAATMVAGGSDGQQKMFVYDGRGATATYRLTFPTSMSLYQAATKRTMWTATTTGQYLNIVWSVTYSTWWVLGASGTLT